MAFVILWDFEGKHGKFVLSKGEYFLGRPTKEDLKFLAGVTAFDVVLFRRDYKEYVNTDIKSLTVSRRHAKLVIDKGLLKIMDHGPDSRGSKNGTFVNNSRLEPGKYRPLSPGDSIRLSSLGPVFTIGRFEGGITRITVTPDMPQELPKSISSRLKEKGLVKESAKQGDIDVVVLKPGVRRLLIQDLGILVIESEHLSRAYRQARLYADVITTLAEALRYLRRDEVGNSIDILRKLRLNVYKEFIKGLNEPDIENIYNNLIWLVSEESVKTQTLENVLCKFMKLLEGVKPF